MVAKKETPSRDRLVARVQEKIARGRQLDNADLLALNGKVWMFNPSLGAYHEMEIEEAERFLESAKQVTEALK